ncbi:MAG: ATP-binding cassette domain-containing protein [Candidatus Lokiarchaeota archaeon]|nr:ATP-binding cassette domain-containing protein [Candidatus Lokiarchaeota archaeon]MBD3338427.1 ATP-binding cassette domain-containing protein [Candidatus Lokiarchaeota archaeon]
MMYFAETHQNPDSGLFIEPEIDSNYRAIHSIDFSLASSLGSKLINPKSNSELKNKYSDFFFDYLFEKQNDNGSFSDIGGLGDLISSYEVIQTIDTQYPDYFNDKSEEIAELLNYIANSLEENGWGFKYNEFSPIGDIISTYSALKMANRFNAPYLYSNENVSRFVNASILLNPTPELRYYSILSFLELGYSINSTLKTILETFFDLRYNPIDGGYSASGGISNIQSTYYSIASLYLLNATPTNENKTLNFALDCINTDGGFRYTTYIINQSDFISGWSGMNTINLIQQNNSTLAAINTNSYRLGYYQWLYQFQALNGLFGYTTIQTNYWGVLAIHKANLEDFEEFVEIDNIWDYIEDCYNNDGGFGEIPNTNSSLFSTWCAINLYQIFFNYEDVELPDINETKEYLSDLQNSDGGFEIGVDIINILSFFGPLIDIVLNLVKTNSSTVESTYWAVSCLDILDGMNLIDEEDLKHWINSCQNADGGFSIILGFHSDTISTYFGMALFKVLNSEPISINAVIEFLKKAQDDDGSFLPFPALSQFFDLPSNFLITYLGSKALYDHDYQPEEIEDLLDYYDDCMSSKTGGVGDFPSFGGDLKNTPYGIILLQELRYDQAFNPEPWNNLIIVIILAEILALLAIAMLRVTSVLSERISKRLKEKYDMTDKLNVTYLQRFPAITCDNMSVYAGRKLIVDSVNIQIEHGEILGVLGESGAGKSTFVKALLGMRKYTGSSRIYGMESKKNSKKIRPIYGYVPQDLGKIYANFTTMQNLIYFGKQYDLTDKTIKNRAKRLLRSLEIEDKAEELIKNLSGGQKRRVSIAIALIHNPIFCILDEPTSGLDPVVRENLWLTLTKINEQFNTTLVVITHYPEESRFCNKVVIFGRNRGMIDFGQPRDLLHQIPGRGRTIELYFNEIKEDAPKKLETIKGIAKALENKVGTDFVLLSDLNMDSLFGEIKKKFPNSIPQMMQRDTKMEEYFRYKAMEVPKLE